MNENTIITIEDLRNKNSEFAQTIFSWYKLIEESEQLLQEAKNVYKDLDQELEQHSMSAQEIQDNYCRKLSNIFDEIVHKLF